MNRLLRGPRSNPSDVYSPAMVAASVDAERKQRRAIERGQFRRSIPGFVGYVQLTAGQLAERRRLLGGARRGDPAAQRALKTKFNCWIIPGPGGGDA